METLFIILIVLSISHFIYEAIILPTVRVEIRYRLFKKRDELFHMRMENETTENKQHYDYLESYINSSIRHIPVLTLTTIYASKNYFRDNPKEEEEADNKIEHFRNGASQDLKKIHAKVVNLNMGSLAANIFMLLIYCLPFVIVLKILRTLGIHLIKYKKVVQRTAFIPDRVYSQYSGSEEIYC